MRIAFVFLFVGIAALVQCASSQQTNSNEIVARPVSFEQDFLLRYLLAISLQNYQNNLANNPPTNTAANPVQNTDDSVAPSTSYGPSQENCKAVGEFNVRDILFDRLRRSLIDEDADYKDLRNVGRNGRS